MSIRNIYEDTIELLRGAGLEIVNAARVEGGLYVRCPQRAGEIAREMDLRLMPSDGRTVQSFISREECADLVRSYWEGVQSAEMPEEEIEREFDDQDVLELIRTNDPEAYQLIDEIAAVSLDNIERASYGSRIKKAARARREGGYGLPTRAARKTKRGVSAGLQYVADVGGKAAQSRPVQSIQKMAGGVAATLGKYPKTAIGVGGLGAAATATGLGYLYGRGAKGRR